MISDPAVFHADQGIDKTLTDCVKFGKRDMRAIELPILKTLQEDTVDQRLNLGCRRLVERPACRLTCVGKADDRHFAILRRFAVVAELRLKHRCVVIPLLPQRLGVEVVDKVVAVVLADRVANRPAHPVLARQ